MLGNPFILGIGYVVRILYKPDWGVLPLKKVKLSVIYVGKQLKRLQIVKEIN